MLQDDLLEQARFLARREPRRPRQASLRRAVSAAYYALFHLLTHEAARQAVAGTGRVALRQTVHRAFKHGDMKTVAMQFAAGRPDGRWNAALSNATVSPDLQTVADTFVVLQQARHRADYDVSRAFRRGEAVAYVEQAEEAFRAMRRARGSSSCDVFLTALLLQRSLNG